MKKILKRFWIWLTSENCEDRWTLDQHRLHGSYCVRYPDGKISQRFSWRVANDYRDMFGGEVIEAIDQAPVNNQ